MSRLTAAVCPGCEASGSLSVRMRLTTKPPGTTSLSTFQLKVDSKERPILGCSSCSYFVVGRLDERGKALFDLGATP